VELIVLKNRYGVQVDVFTKTGLGEGVWAETKYSLRGERTYVRGEAYRSGGNKMRRVQSHRKRAEVEVTLQAEKNKKSGVT